MNETKLGFFSRLYYSITSFDKYRLFLRQSTGKSVVYLLLITLVLSIAVNVSTYNEFSKVIDLTTGYIAENIPDFRFDNGKLEVNGDMPFVIESEGVPVVIDTRPGAEDIILNQYDTVMLITSEKFIVKNYVDRSEVPLSLYQGLVMTRDDLIRSIPMMKPVLTIIFIIAGLFFIIGKFISALIVSLIGMAVNSIKRTNLTYRSIFKISIYSMTLPLIVCTILNILQLSVPFLWVLFYIGCAIYITGSLNRIKYEISALAGDPESFGGFANDAFGTNTFSDSDFRANDFDKDIDDRTKTDDLDNNTHSISPYDSGEPANTDKPSGSDEPTNMDKPSNSDEPTDKDVHDDSGEPAHTDKPSGSDEPTDMDKPSNSDEPTDKDVHDD